MTDRMYTNRDFDVYLKHYNHSGGDITLILLPFVGAPRPYGNLDQ